ncbi:MAG TPA: YidC/Oxa1 family membrane protein insertase [Candidatus Limnocylindrales bacterium]|nr:YidC/Oxa1 family membrane protein insertase [Candidatus Limnocylindrales bacterium]
MTTRSWPARIGPLLLIAVIGLVVAGCLGGSASLPPGVTAAPTPTPPAGIPLAPAPLNPDPFSFLSWLFTPVFQVFFITLVALDQLTGNIAIAIILLTIIIKVLLIPVFRRQLVSTRRMQQIAPELKEIQRRFKGDRVKTQQATAQLYKERGVSPLGCLPIVLQMFLLIPLYSVFSQGLQNFNIQPMMEVFGFTILNLNCDAVPIFGPNNTVLNPCLNPTAFGVNWGVPEVFLGSPGALFSGLSILAIISSLVQLVASRMTLPAATAAGADDQNVKMQRQMAIFLPFISLIYGSILPAGLFLYWIGSTIFSIVQQYLILGWGGMFPIFGWTPRFAVDHTPRFPVAAPTAPPSSSREPGTPARPKPDRSALDRSASAQATIRQRGRQGRRGRRR